MSEKHNYINNPFSHPDAGALDTHRPLSDDEIISQERLVIDGLLDRISTARHEGFVDASTDLVTKLPNRALFDRELEERVASGGPFSLCVLDVTGLKRANDQRGHLTGDKLLYALGQAISNATRETDMVARVGGDEFAVIVSDVPHRDNSLTKDERNDAFTSAVIQELKVFTDKEGLTGYGITVSVGISPHLPGEPVNETYERADKKMYEHKKRQYTANGITSRAG